EEGLARLLASPIAPRLQALSIVGHHLGGDRIAALGRARLDALRELRCDDPAGVRRVLPHVECIA
ncbi:MAG: hypothetical protein K2W96_02130, partial [Gemmataceae bacterium]|nr:hypothetical protein [Gemmataceae bacterium]